MFQNQFVLNANQTEELKASVFAAYTSAVFLFQPKGLLAVFLTELNRNKLMTGDEIIRQYEMKLHTGGTSLKEGLIMFDTIMKELESLGNSQTKKTYAAHGGKEPLFGVKVGDLNSLIKKYKLKNSHDLALKLYSSGNYDAMYLAGLVADSAAMTKDTVMLWLSEAYCEMIAEYAVGSAASETAFAMELVRELIQSDKELYASCGYSMLAFYVMRVPDAELDKNELSSLLRKIESSIHTSPNRVRFQMNAAAAAVGTSVPDLFDEVFAAGERIGSVMIDTGGARIKVPSITEKLMKAKKYNRVGNKRKAGRC